MVEESGGESRRYLKWDCNRSDILHQLKKKTGGACQMLHRNATETLALT